MEDTGTQTTESASAASSETTLGNASAALAAADSSPATTQTPVETPAAAITPSADGTPVSTEATGEPPKWRWQDILANARETTAKETADRVKQEVEQQYAGLKDLAGLSADERAGLVVWNRALRGDAQAQAHVAQANPQLAVSLGWTKAPTADPEPEADLQAQDGTLVYSAKQQKSWQDWNKRQLTKELTDQFSERLRPFETVAKTFQEREQHAAAWTTVSQTLAEFRNADPAFKTHEADIKAQIAQDSRLAQLADADPKAALEIAWGRVWKSKVLPSQQKSSEATVLANLQQRAVSGTLNPASATPTTPANTIGNARAALLAAGGE